MYKCVCSRACVFFCLSVSTQRVREGNREEGWRDGEMEGGKKRFSPPPRCGNGNSIPLFTRIKERREEGRREGGMERGMEGFKSCG